MTTLVKAVTAPVRLPVNLLVALADIAGELPGTVREVRTLVGALARLASEDGELTLVLREAARLAARSDGLDGARGSDVRASDQSAAPRAGPQRRREPVGQR